VRWDEDKMWIPHPRCQRGSRASAVPDSMSHAPLISRVPSQGALRFGVVDRARTDAAHASGVDMMRTSHAVEGRLRYSAVVMTLLVAGCPQTEDQGPFATFYVTIEGGGDGSGVVSVESATALPWECIITDGKPTDDCTRAYSVEDNGSLEIVLTAGASSSHFQGWGGECAGTNERCRLSGEPYDDLVVKANFEAIPVVELAVEGHTDVVMLPEGLTATAEATATAASGAAISQTTYTWVSSDPDVARLGIGTTGPTATVTAVAPGTATLTVSTRGVTSNAVEVTVVGLEPLPGVIRGILYDADDATPLDSVFLTMGMVDAQPGSTVYRATTGRQLGGDPLPIPSGGYRIAVDDAGRYAVFGVGVLGSRWVSTPGDTAYVFPGDTTDLDLNIKRGYHLDMLGTDLGTITATAGSTIDLVVDYQAWNRDLCPGCVPALAVGVDGDALNVYRFEIPGIYPGRTERGVAIPVTVPDHGGGIYAMLVTVSTGAGIEPGLQQYEARWAANLQATTMIRIGKLSVN
jgi:hypothetical protein